MGSVATCSGGGGAREAREVGLCNACTPRLHLSRDAHTGWQPARARAAPRPALQLLPNPPCPTRPTTATTVQPRPCRACADRVSLSPMRSSCTATVSFSFTMGTAPSLQAKASAARTFRATTRRQELALRLPRRPSSRASHATFGTGGLRCAGSCCDTFHPTPTSPPPHRSSSSNVFFAQMYWLRLARLSRVSSTWAHFCSGGSGEGEAGAGAAVSRPRPALRLVSAAPAPFGAHMCVAAALPNACTIRMNATCKLARQAHRPRHAQRWRCCSAVECIQQRTTACLIGWTNKCSQLTRSTAPNRSE